MHYIVQENVFREQHYDLLFKALDRLGLTYTTVRIFPFIDKVVNLDVIPDADTGNYIVDELPDYEPKDKNNVFAFGALKLARIAALKDWHPASLMNSNHDYEVYSKHYKDNLLNYDSVVTTIGATTGEYGYDYWKKDQYKFVRPTQDTKSFTGKVFTRNQWLETVEHNLHNFRSEQFNENTPIQISTPKNIYKEIRFWVVGGKIITGSVYQDGGKHVLSDVYEESAVEFAQSMVDLFQLADAFVIDVCLTDDNQWKIVECGCINCAGFYKSDLQKTIIALENKFN